MIHEIASTCTNAVANQLATASANAITDNAETLMGIKERRKSLCVKKFERKIYLKFDAIKRFFVEGKGRSNVA